MKNEIKESVFKDFTRKYSLSKTLRFELIPEGKTLENMRNHLRYDKELQTFLADQEIEDAYQILKPVFDYLHEQFITESLESETAKKLNFKGYLEKYKNRKELKDKDFEVIEKTLRKAFAGTYEEAAENFRERAGKDAKGKYLLEDRGCKILTEQGILKYIEKNIESFIEIKPKEEIKKALKDFK
jgi:CRISPR-associated protein Cpf1